MYEYLEGRIEASAPARLVLEVGGVGYDIAVPLGARFGSGGGDVVRVWTHLVVRDDAHLLFGFPDQRTREWFRMLLAVRGVGPGLALGLLSGLPVERLHATILEGDPEPLVRIRGVGRKTAEQILLDLRDRAARFAPGPDDGGALVPRPDLPAAIGDAVSALVSIGYAERDARRSVERAAKRVDSSDIEALVRASLQE